MYQIVREAVANAVKHAQPDTIAILSTVLPDGRTEIGSATTAPACSASGRWTA